MTGPLLRAVAAAACVVVAAWLVVGLRSARLEAEAERLAAPGKYLKLEPEDGQRAVELLEDAREHSADTSPDVRQAYVHLLQGDARRARPLLEDVVRSEPENYDAWALLVLAARPADPARAREARDRAGELNPLARAERRAPQPR